MARKITQSRSSKRRAVKAKPKARKPRRAKPIPAGYHSITPYLIVNGAAAALEFYKTAFGAKEKLRMSGTDGRIGHAEIVIGNSRIMLADEHPDINARAPQAGTPTAVGIMLYVKDVDAVFKRATANGARSERPPQDQFYGDRTSTLVDPFGHRWFISTHIEDVSPKELQRRIQNQHA